MATGDLTTAAKVRDYLKLKTSEADATLAQLVTSSSRWVVSQIGRPVLSATYTGETHDGDGSTSLVLRNWPVISVSSLSVDGTTIPARATVSDSGYVIDGSSLRLSGYTFTKGTQNVSVTYTAGYATVPEDLEQAVIEHVALRFRDADHQGIAMAAGGGESVTYTTNSASLAYIRGVLDTYMEIVAG